MMMKKLFAGILAAAMVFSMTMTAFAAKTADSGKGGSASITITLPTDSAGTDEEITYHVYKVFDAKNDGTSTTAISYSIDAANGELSADMKTAGFLVDDAGNVHYGTFAEDAAGTYVVGGKTGTITAKTTLDDSAIKAIAAYATDEIGSGFKAKPSDGTLAITNLEYGYYYITTTTGSVVTIDSTVPNAAVDDKNSIPTPPDKKITGVGTGSLDSDGQKALAQVGTKVEFEATIKKVKGASNYVFHDTMSKGLEYNDDVAVTPAGAVYTKTQEGDDTITLKFDNTWLASLEDNTDITITYSATVTSDALSIDAANNTATLGYGNSHTTKSDSVNVYNAKFSVTKSDGDGKALEGAGFIVKSGDLFYKIANNIVSWVSDSADATEYKSDADGVVPAFTGLADGTYVLVEKTVPVGYNKAADLTFTIEAGDYEASNLEQTANVVNNAGTELPSTGGIGTTIFYIVGAILALGAGVLLVARRRMSNI